MSNKYDYIDAILSDLPWLLRAREEQGYSMRDQALVYARRLSQRMTMKELQAWNEQVCRECVIETERIRLEQDSGGE